MIGYRVPIYKNLSWLFFDKIFHLFMGIFVTVWIARYLGAVNYGILSYAIAYTSFFSIFVKLGLDKILIREVVKFPEKISAYLGTAFFFKVYWISNSNSANIYFSYIL
jgi:O-antigen/teichoic acid export membrane protein